MKTSAERSSREDVSIGPIFAQHLAAYKYAQQFSKNKTVLDFGCGEGYGSALLGEGAAGVTGVDYSSEAIIKARQRYANSNIEFICSDLKCLKFAEKTFDVIAAFQLIEHLRRPEEFILKINAWLKEDGVFLLTTPNRRASIVQHPYHFREYTKEELGAFLNKYFLKTDLFGLSFNEKVAQFRKKRFNESQKLLKIDKLRLHMFIPRFLRQKIFDFIASILSKKIYLENKGLSESITCDDYKVSEENIDQAIDLVCVCRQPILVASE